LSKEFFENIEMKALKILPLFNGSYIDELEVHWKENKPLLNALSSLDSDGIVDLLPGNAVVLTEAGQLIKRALQSVPDYLIPITWFWREKNPVVIGNYQQKWCKFFIIG